MKKLVLFAMIVTCFSIFNACEKSNELIDQGVGKQLKEAIVPDVYSENGMLIFKSQQIFDSIIAQIQNMNDDEFSNWENSLGFISANTYLLKAEDEFINADSKDEIDNFKKRHSDFLKISDDFEEIDLRFYSKAIGNVLNVEGKVKIGSSLYLFTDEKEYIILNGDEKCLTELKNEKSANTNIIIFDPFSNENLKSTSEKEFLIGGELYDSDKTRRLNYTFERIITVSVHSVNLNEGYNYSINHQLFFRLKQYKKKRGKYRSNKASYDVKNQSIHWRAIVAGQQVGEFNGTVADKHFGSTKNSVYIYYRDYRYITSTPAGSSLFVENYSCKFRSSGVWEESTSDKFKQVSYSD